MFKNRWRLAFFASLLSLITVVIVAFSLIVNQGISHTYLQNNYTWTRDDLEILVELLNTKSFDKTKVIEVLKTHQLYEYRDFKSDTIQLNNIKLIFDENGVLKEMDWRY